jgi:hypothetical protein
MKIFNIDLVLVFEGVNKDLSNYITHYPFSQQIEARSKPRAVEGERER